MRLDQFTVKAQESIASAQKLAERADHPEVTPEHLLKALIEQEGGVVPAALGKLGLNPRTIVSDVDGALAGDDAALEQLELARVNSRRREPAAPLNPGGTASYSIWETELS